MTGATEMPALNSCERVMTSSVSVPPPLQPQTPTRAGSTNGWAFSHFTPATMSASSPSVIILRTIVFSSVLLRPVALRGSTEKTT